MDLMRQQCREGTDTPTGVARGSLYCPLVSYVFGDFRGI